MTKLAQLTLKKQETAKALQTFMSQHKDPTTGEMKADTPKDDFKSLQDAFIAAKSEWDTEDQIVRLGAEAAAVLQSANNPANQHVHGAASKGTGPLSGVINLGHVAPITAFKHVSGDPTAAPTKAYRFGRWYLAAFHKHAGSIAWCKDNNIEIKSLNESGDSSNGGILVPEEFTQDLIDLREYYGVFRKNARIVPMSSDTKRMPRRRGGVVAYYIGEGKAPALSDIKFDDVRLTAKKLAAMIVMSSEVLEDAIIDLGNQAAEEIGYAFATAEDDAGFLGDGSSTYGNILGVIPKLLSLSGTIANISSLVLASGNAWDEIVYKDFLKVVGKLPQFGDTPRTKWFCHKTFYFTVMLRAAAEQGGTNMAEIIAGVKDPMFMGYPVEFVQRMPKTEANSQIPVLFGDLSQAATLGDRRQLTIAVSEHLRFDTDELVMRGIQRYDINVHDVGNADADPNKRIVGPVVGLITQSA